MASISDFKPQMPAGDARHYLGPVPEGRRRTALAMLLTGRSREDDPAVEHFEQFALQQKLPLDGLWVAAEHGPAGRLLGTILIVPNPGATAMLFVGQATAWRDHPLIVRLIQHACRDEKYTNIRVIQSLVDPGQIMEARALEQAGLTKLAKLVYMQKPMDRREFATPLPKTLAQKPTHIYYYSQDNHSRFAQAILASYENTLDCPGLVGLRHVDQIIQGHQSTGRFDPNLWHAFFDEQDNPVAALLLAPSAIGAGFELVYLGVAQAYRGKGVGSQLMSFAVAQSARHGADRLFLAVDDRNTPAVRLYNTMGFRATTRKIAYIMPR